MRCYYINLAAQPDRRADLERNFHESRLEGWSLERIEAVDKEEAAASGRGPGLRPGEVACFLSHLRALERAEAIEGHAFVVEDDVLFGPSTRASVERALASAPAAWDLLFTDICVPNYQYMIELFLGRRQLVPGSREFLVDLKALPFCGSTAYIVNAASKARVRAMLEGVRGLAQPYDLWLRDRVYESRLRAFAVFPFATSLSRHAESSQVQAQATTAAELAWNAFRRLAWADGSAALATAGLRQVAPGYVDEETAAFASILALLLSRDFVAK